MKKFRAIFCGSLLASLSLFALAACGKENKANTGDEVQIQINETKIEMNVGETYDLKVTVSPADPEEKAVEWSSSDTSVGTVEMGRVTAKAEGRTIITATSSGKCDTCEVTVKPNSPEENNTPDNGGVNNGENGNSENGGDNEGENGNTQNGGTQNENGSENGENNQNPSTNENGEE